jgi:hypothetical protein
MAMRIVPNAPPTALTSAEGGKDSSNPLSSLSFLSELMDAQAAFPGQKHADSAEKSTSTIHSAQDAKEDDQQNLPSNPNLNANAAANFALAALTPWLQHGLNGANPTDLSLSDVQQGAVTNKMPTSDSAAAVAFSSAMQEASGSSSDFNQGVQSDQGAVPDRSMLSGWTVWSAEQTKFLNSASSANPTAEAPFLPSVSAGANQQGTAAQIWGQTQLSAPPIQGQQEVHSLLTQSLNEVTPAANFAQSSSVSLIKDADIIKSDVDIDSISLGSAQENTDTQINNPQHLFTAIDVVQGSKVSASLSSSLNIDGLTLPQMMSMELKHQNDSLVHVAAKGQEGVASSSNGTIPHGIDDDQSTASYAMNQDGTSAAIQPGSAAIASMPGQNWQALASATSASGAQQVPDSAKSSTATWMANLEQMGSGGRQALSEKHDVGLTEKTSRSNDHWTPLAGKSDGAMLQQMHAEGGKTGSNMDAVNGSKFQFTPGNGSLQDIQDQSKARSNLSSKTEVSDTALGDGTVSNNSHDHSMAGDALNSSISGFSLLSDPANKSNDSDAALKLPAHQVRLDTPEVVDKIQSMAKAGGGELRIDLTPPDEKSFKITLTVKSGQDVSLMVSGASDAIRNRMDQSSDQLRQHFSQLGMNLNLNFEQSGSGNFQSQAQNFGFDANRTVANSKPQLTSTESDVSTSSSSSVSSSMINLYA